MSKQTAVEWLVKIYLQKGKIDSFDIEQAKAMEHEQMFDFTKHYHVIGEATDTFYKYEFDQYYNETYKGGEQ